MQKRDTGSLGPKPAQHLCFLCGQDYIHTGSRDDRRTMSDERAYMGRWMSTEGQQPGPFLSQVAPHWHCYLLTLCWPLTFKPSSHLCSITGCKTKKIQVQIHSTPIRKPDVDVHACSLIIGGWTQELGIGGWSAGWTQVEPRSLQV